MSIKASRTSTRRTGDEPELITRARTGDPDAWAALYNESRETVYQFIYRRTNDHALAEDITSDTFLRAMRRIETYAWTGRAFPAWLITIARNLITDYYKSARYQREWPHDQMADGDELEPSVEELVVAHLESERRTAQLGAARAQLTLVQQQLLELRFWQGLNVAQTAAAMGRREGAVKTMQTRAVKALARHIVRTGAPAPAEFAVVAA